MKEKEVNTEIKNSLELLDCYAFKVPDSIYNPKARFSPDKGVDLFCGVRGKFVAIETKVLKHPAAFGRQLRDSQVETLNSAVRTGNRAFVFLNIRRNANEDINHLDRENLLVIFDWKLWWPKFAAGSIKKAELEKYAAKVGIKGHRKLFDLLPFVNNIDKANIFGQFTFDWIQY